MRTTSSVLDPFHYPFTSNPTAQVQALSRYSYSCTGSVAVWVRIREDTGARLHQDSGVEWHLAGTGTGHSTACTVPALSLQQLLHTAPKFLTARHPPEPRDETATATHQTFSLPPSSPHTQFLLSRGRTRGTFFRELRVIEGVDGP